MTETDLALTAEEVAEARSLVADLLVAAPDKAERHLRLIDAILARNHDDAAWLRAIADGSIDA